VGNSDDAAPISILKQNIKFASGLPAHANLSLFSDVRVFALNVFFCLSILALPASGGEADLLGQTEATLVDRMGDPVGRIELQDRTLLLYPRGEITLHEGRVSAVDLITESELAAREAQKARDREAWQIAQAERKAERIKEGRALRAEKLGSSQFAAMSAEYRVDFWRRFQSRYPEVDVTEHIAEAVASYELELEELRTRERIAQLEARVAEAEREAAAARLETEELRKRAERAEQQRYYGLRYVTDPVRPPIRHAPYRPPTITIDANGNGTIIHRHGHTRH
jgi:hypothetical protein